MLMKYSTGTDEVYNFSYQFHVNQSLIQTNFNFDILSGNESEKLHFYMIYKYSNELIKLEL